MYSILFACTITLIASIGINGWTFEAMSLNPSFGPSAETLLIMGAKHSGLIVNEYQIWRLFTPMFLREFFKNLSSMYKKRHKLTNSPTHPKLLMSCLYLFIFQPNNTQRWRSHTLSSELLCIFLHWSCSGAKPWNCCCSNPLYDPSYWECTLELYFFTSIYFCWCIWR